MRKKKEGTKTDATDLNNIIKCTQRSLAAHSTFISVAFFGK